MFEDNFWADNGFDELRRVMKQGSDFMKEIVGIMNDRADIEKNYTKGLVQLSKKARSLSESWQKYCESLEYESELHKTLSQQLQEDCIAPIKVFIEDNMRKRKPLEQAVEKQKKIYLDRYSDQLKLKRNAHSKCREREQVCDQLEASRNRTEKEITKLEKACKKIEDTLVKADRDYKESNIKTEESRLAWESSMYTCCRYLENLEHTRLQQVTDTFKKYCELMLTQVDPLKEMCGGLTDSAESVSADRDIEYLCQHNGTGPNNPEQLLLDTYEDDVNNHMDIDRRAASLDKKIQELEMDIDRKEKEKKAYGENPDFVDEKGAADVDRQIIEANAMLNMLKANHFKLLKARSEVSPDSPYTEYIQTRRDKQGQIMTLLCVPIHQVSELEEQTELPTWTPPSPPTKHTGLNNAYGASKATKVSSTRVEEPPPYTTLPQDEFDAGQDDYQYICRCEVLYDYEPQQEDELKIFPGDTIYVTEKIDDSWWQGNLNGTLGLFPASYVEEVETF